MTRGVPSIVRRLAILAICSGLAVASAATADTFDLRVEPSQPDVLNPVTLIATVESSNTYSLIDVVSVSVAVASDLDITVEIADLEAPGAPPWTFVNPPGVLSPATIDVVAFACDP